MIKKENLNVINYFNLAFQWKAWQIVVSVGTVLYPVKLCSQKSSKTPILMESDPACE